MLVIIDKHLKKIWIWRLQKIKDCRCI